MNPRGLNKNEILVLINNKEQKLNKENIHQKHNVLGIIRLRPKEYNYAIKRKDWTHWNLHPAHHTINNRYLIAKVLKNGALINGQETPPLIDIKDSFIVKSIKRLDPIIPSEINKSHLTRTYPWITSVESLTKSIIDKYKQSLPDKSVEELRKMPLAMTLLKRVN